MDSYITDNQIVEGFLASIVWGIFFIYMRNRLEWPSWVEGGIAWFMVWAVRKFGITIYESLKKKYDWKDFRVYLLPELKIEVQEKKDTKSNTASPPVPPQHHFGLLH